LTLVNQQLTLATTVEKLEKAKLGSGAATWWSGKKSAAPKFGGNVIY
jgi:predicted phage gp36 major capsid-like protein